jgi:hypothetical protein
MRDEPLEWTSPYVDAGEAIDTLWEGIMDAVDVDTTTYDLARGGYAHLLREGYQIVKVKS